VAIQARYEDDPRRDPLYLWERAGVRVAYEYELSVHAECSTLRRREE